MVGVGVLAVGEHAGEAEVPEACLEREVDQDVARLDVAVEHHGLVLMVNVLQPGCNVTDDAVASAPLADRSRRMLLIITALAEELLVQAAIGHVLVDEYGLTSVVRPP